MLIVFDLDFTLWDCDGTWCDHTTPPYYKHNGIIKDDLGRNISLYPDVRKLLTELHEKKAMMAVASRTSAPNVANELMELFNIKKYFDHFEIYPGSKIHHFKSLQQKTGKDYHDMVFFDDEYRNIQEVSQLGVQTVFVEDGMNYDLTSRLSI